MSKRCKIANISARRNSAAVLEGVEKIGCRIRFVPVLALCCRVEDMAKKRKAGSRSARPANGAESNAKTKYDINEEFADSEDEFFAGRNKVLLDEEPASKRRRRARDEGESMSERWKSKTVLMLACRTIPAALRRGGSRI